MPFEYTLPLTGVSVQNVTYTATGASTLSGITGTLNLSAVTTLTNTLCVGAGYGTRFSLFFRTLQTASTAAPLSAGPNDIFLTIPNSRGGTVVYGYVDSSTLNTTTSGYTINIKFRDMDYLATTLALSGSRTSCTFQNTTVIDNPLIVRIGTPSINTVNAGLSTTNRYFRTVSRQTRLVQGEY
jgi:hypothetical protein